MLCTVTILILTAGGTDSLPAQDTARVYVAPEVVVQADAVRQPWRTDRPVSSTGSVDDLMRCNGLTLIQRANGFAGEVTMMGLRGAQVNSTIDGMKIHAACVDKMDPNTAYVEIDNLTTMNINADGSDLRYGQALGGSVNFTLRRPEYTKPVRTLIDAAAESNAFLRRLRIDASGGTERVGLRAGYTLRTASDMRDGNDVTIPTSGYTKQNLQVVGGWKLNDSNEFQLSFIGDRATDVGYPALIMDTRKADAVIGALTWRRQWSSSLRTSAKVYANAIDHTMDDYDRPLTQIETRAFMPNMYMPMTGTTSVGGLLVETSISTSSTLINIIVDATYLAANATMEMIPLDTTVTPMFMTNIGDARIATAGLSAALDHEVADGLSFRAGARADVSSRTVRDEAFRSVISGYNPGVPLDVTALAGSVHGGLYHELADDLDVWAVLAYNQRMPTHLEMYGFWLYDPQANIIMNGRADLANENAMSMTVGGSYRQDDLSISGSLYVRRVGNYIGPDPATAIVQQGQPPVRTMGNLGTAMLTGFTATAFHSMASWFGLHATLRGVWGQSLAFDDPLPLLDPLTAMLRAVVGDATIQGEVAFSGALRQSRTSSAILPEDTTPAWMRVDLLIAWRPLAALRIQAACTNVFDTFYHEHTSINNMPARGRSFNAGLRVDL
jgi:iron complex outermembrane receptor protein